MTENAAGWVARRTRTAAWNLIGDGECTASAHAICRPDRRWFVSIDTWDEAAYAPLLRAVVEDLRQDLYTNRSGDDGEGLDRWRGLGFEVARRTILYAVPVDPMLTGLGDAAVPAGIVLLSADAVDEDRLRELDDELRADVPGTEGWVSDPTEFREYTFDERRFDPSTYLVALDDAREEFAGLARIWNHPVHAWLGLIGVTPPYRRRGLARALLGAAFAPLHERGVTSVAAQTDATSVASVALLEGIGARHTDETLELIRRQNAESATEWKAEGPRGTVPRGPSVYRR